MRAIVETDSHRYLLLRSQELLREADDSINRCEHLELVTKAISLLALHLVKDQLSNDKTPSDTRKKSCGKGKEPKPQTENPRNLPRDECG
jgi:hypothetical protein